MFVSENVFTNYRQCHEGCGSAHFDRDKTVNKVEERFYWAGMFNDVKNFIAGCDKCQKTNPKLKKTMPSLHPIPVPSEPWKQVCIINLKHGCEQRNILTRRT